MKGYAEKEKGGDAGASSRRIMKKSPVKKGFFVGNLLFFVDNYVEKMWIKCGKVHMHVDIYVNFSTE